MSESAVGRTRGTDIVEGYGRLGHSKMATAPGAVPNSRQLSVVREEHAGLGSSTAYADESHPHYQLDSGVGLTRRVTLAGNSSYQGEPPHFGGGSMDNTGLHRATSVRTMPPNSG